MKTILSMVFIITLSISGFSQATQAVKLETKTSFTKYSYAHILVEGKAFTKKLKVSVDFGDTEQQLEAGRQFSEKLTNKKSYAAILNAMVESKFELVETLDYTANYGGSGGTSGIVFIMRKRSETD